MATCDKHICDICSTQHVTSAAIVWCPECEENFCEKCKLHHTVAKATKKHETIAIEQVSKLPQFVRDIKMTCFEHNERVVYFCSKHDTPFCVECHKPYHSDCSNLITIQQMAQDIKSSTSFSDLEALVADIITNIDNMTKDRREYVESLHTMKSKFVQDLKAARSAIDEYFDKLERQLLVEMEHSFTEKSTEIEKLLNELASHREKVTDIQEQLGLIKSYASDFQTFFAMREMTKSVDKEEQEVQILLDGDLLKWITLTLQPTELKVIEEHMSSLGQIHMQANPCNLKSVVRKVKEAQLIGNISSPRSIQEVRLIERIYVSIPKLIGKKGVQILDCCILLNGNLVFIDRKNNLIIILDNKGNMHNKINLSFPPRRFTCLTDTRVAITSSDRIFVVDLVNGQVVQKIDLKVDLRSISRTNDYFIAESDMGYNLLDFQGNVLEKISVSFVDHKYHALARIKDSLYYVEPETNKLQCCDAKGNLMWNFQNADLKQPYGLTSDNSNILFVAAYTSKNVFAVAVDGKSFSEVIKPTIKLQTAVAAFYSVERKELLLATYDGNVLLYDDV